MLEDDGPDVKPLTVVITLRVMVSNSPARHYAERNVYEGSEPRRHLSCLLKNMT
jgi:hypothetical protein